MKKVSDLFERFKNFIPPERIYKNEFIQVVEEEVGIHLQKEEIEIQKLSIRVKVRPIVRTKILLKKGKILEKLKDILKERAPKDIL